MQPAVGLDRLRGLLPPEQFVTDDLDRYAVDGLRPQAALQPGTVDEVSALLRAAGEQRLAIIPRGAGLHMDLGNVPARYDLALDLSRLNAVVDYSPEDLVVTVQAGVTLSQLDRLLEERGQFLALDTPLAGEATIGGTLSANLVAPNRVRYGTARDLVIGLTCVLSDGSVVRSGGRVVKNVAGYDLNKLYIGALGTLGVIVEASFKLHPRPAARTGLAGGFAGGAAAYAAALAIANSPLGVLGVEVAGPPLAHRVGEHAAVPNGWLAAVFLAGLPAAIERQRREATALLQDAVIVADLSSSAQAQLYASLRDAGRTPERSAALILRCSVLPGQVGEAVERLQSGAGLRGAQVAASPGAGSLRLFWRQTPDGALGLIEAIRGSIADMGGNVIIERCPAEMKASLDVWGTKGPDAELMRAMKAAYDPANILSPGRMLPDA